MSSSRSHTKWPSPCVMIELWPERRSHQRRQRPIGDRPVAQLPGGVASPAVATAIECDPTRVFVPNSYRSKLETAAYHQRGERAVEVTNCRKSARGSAGRA